MEEEQIGGREDNPKSHVVTVEDLRDERMFTPKQQFEETYNFQDHVVHRANKKGTYKRKKEDRKSLTARGTEETKIVEHKRQVPEEVEVDNLSPKKLKLLEGHNNGEGMTEEDDGGMELYNVMAGLPGQSRLTK